METIQNKKKKQQDSVSGYNPINWELISENTEPLCKRCEGIDLNDAVREIDGILVHRRIMDLGTPVAEWETSKCPLCRMFATLMPSNHQEIVGCQNISLQLWTSSKITVGGRMTLLRIAHSGDEFSEWSKALNRNPYLGYFSLDEIAGGYGIRPISPKVFDVHFAKECITYCQKNHGNDCNQAKQVKVPLFFNVIDCEKRVVIPAPSECSYAALSYVWDKMQIDQVASETTSATSLDNCSKVISDGIEVTLKLGLRYLWVDRYCIDQLNAEIKQNQMRKMDLVYSNAQVTIIAAVTKVQGLGLPGVSEMRTPRPSFIIRDRLIAYTLLESLGPVSRSKWVTRCWTYQDQVLSKRRLIFTDDEVFFECNGMQCAESVVLPFCSIDDENEAKLKKGIFSSPHGPDSQIIDPYSIWCHISQYSTRELSSWDERLNAIDGIFRLYQELPQPVYQFIGIPIMPPCYYNKSLDCWKKISRTSEQSFLIGLTWKSFAISKKTSCFPTWSWAGLTGEIAPYLIFDNKWNASPENVSVSIELQDGSLLQFPNIPELLDMESGKILKSTKFIHIKAKTFSCTAVRFEDAPHYSQIKKLEWNKHALMKIAVDEGTELYVIASLDREIREDKLSSKIFKGIVVGDFSIDGPKTWQGDCRVAIIFVEELDEHAERLAVGSFDFSTALYANNELVDLSHEILLELSEKFLKTRTIRLG